MPAIQSLIFNFSPLDLQSKAVKNASAKLKLLRMKRLILIFSTIETIAKSKLDQQ